MENKEKRKVEKHREMNRDSFKQRKNFKYDKHRRNGRDREYIS